MSLASFAVPPRSIEQLSIWSFSHSAHHHDIVRRIFEVYGTSLPEYVLDPFNPLDMALWLDQHQDMHNDMNQAAGGLAGSDLTELDWSDADSLSAWLARNYSEHVRVGIILGV